MKLAQPTHPDHPLARAVIALDRARPAGSDIQASWEAHVEALRKPEPIPSPGTDYRLSGLERILGIGRVGIW